jgi:hypothetical protein
MRRAIIFVALACGGSASAQVVYTNGSFNNLSSVSPQNWDPNGIIQDFPSEASQFNRIRIEAQDSTTPVGQVSSITAARIRIYALVGRPLSALSFTETPVFDRTYTTGANTLRKTLSGFVRGGADVEYFDLIGEGALGVGTYAMFYNLPGHQGTSHYWLSSTPPFPGGAARIFGPGINGAIGGPDNEGAFTIYRDIVPEPATMFGLAAGIGLLIRRRRV